MITFLTIAVVSAFVLLLIAWEVFRRRGGIPAVSARQVMEMLRSSGEPPLILDVRTSAEYSLFHIPGARSAPDVLLRPDLLDDVDKSRPIVVA